MILSVELHGCEMWFIILREKHKPRVFEHRRLTKTFGPKRKEVAGKWRKICNEELASVLIIITKCYSSKQIKEKNVGRTCGVWEKIIAHRISVT